MKDDLPRLDAIIRSIHPGPLTLAEAETIVELAQLAVDADGREDADEIATFFTLGKIMFTLAGVSDIPTPTFASDEDDTERLHALVAQFDRTPPRELAFVAALILTTIDAEVAPEERTFLATLRTALGIDADRVRALAAATRKR